MVATARSDRACGRFATTVPLIGRGTSVEGMGIDWTVGTVSGDPPPITKIEDPITAAEPSCTGEASEPTLVAVPLWGSRVCTEATLVPEAVRPPRTVTSGPEATTEGRDMGAPSDQDSTPASIESGGIPPIGLT